MKYAPLTALNATGRFAPSPTGPLHLGSLVAAAGSWLFARAGGGRWLVRMEDLDTPRVVPGADQAILESLRRYGLEWDGKVTWQSKRIELYEDSLTRLRAIGAVFDCACSRAELARAASAPAAGDPHERIYPGTCRGGLPEGRAARAVRFAVPEGVVSFDDLVVGRCRENVAAETGDFVVRRADGVFAYQLAVVVDDAVQEVTEVVRGADLLGSTARQIALQEALGLPRPRYAHLPLVVGPDGSKLGKRDGALPLPALDDGVVRRSLAFALAALGIEVAPEPPERMLVEALRQFDAGRVPRGLFREEAACMSDDIKVSHNESKSQFETTVEGALAVASYDLEGDDRIVFTHTNVPAELSGRGIGGQLAKAALEYARARKLKVVPQCSFIAKYIERNPQYKDLL